MSKPYFTIGHSTRTANEFVALMREAGATMVVDVRTIPRSRMNPQFNIDTFAVSLAEHGIAYRHFPDLGGLRKLQNMRSPNDFWKAGGFRNYADYAMTEEFRRAMAACALWEETKPAR